jgi:hypothetical protein
MYKTSFLFWYAYGCLLQSSNMAGVSVEPLLFLKFLTFFRVCGSYSFVKAANLDPQP